MLSVVSKGAATIRARVVGVDPVVDMPWKKARFERIVARQGKALSELLAADRCWTWDKRRCCDAARKERWTLSGKSLVKSQDDVS